MKQLLFTLVLFLGSTSSTWAQFQVHRSNEIPVSIDGNSIDHAWAGGINSSQWSRIDLNIDGHLDLFIYDRSSDQFQTYLQDPLTGLYTLTFDYADSFPEMDYWVLLRDFNCDGRVDIFTSVPGGIRLYENTSINDILSFELRSDLLESFHDFGTDPFYANIYVSTVDIPSIDDFDGDGDLDIHTFTLQGTTIEYHMNMAADIGNCDSLAFVLANRCYGYIAEDAVSPTIYIGDDLPENWCTYNVIDPHELGNNEAGPRHSGSSICTFDYDGNGQEDLLIGDITATDISLVYLDDRGPLPDSAFSLEVGWPQGQNPIDMHVFHNGYFIDVDNDGLRDVIVTPSNGTESEDQASCYFYKNTGSNDDVDVNFVSSSFIQNQMIDLGSLSFPRLVDYNVDGLLDLVVSNRGKYQDGGVFEEKVWLFENVGTPTYPIFELVTDNAFGLNDLGFGDHIALAFGDLDDDGDMDMALGDGSGELHFFENQAAVGNPIDLNLNYTTLLDESNEPVDLGASLIPQLFDLDGDNLLDLIVGERNGNINYLENQGSSSSYYYVLVEDSIGNLVTDVDGNLIGYSAPWLYRDSDGDINAVIGGENGLLMYFENLDADTSSFWLPVDSTAFGAYNGERSCPVVGDLDADLQLDIINGNQSGGLGLYMGGEFPSDIPEYGTGTYVPFRLYPNPTSTYLNLSSMDGRRADALRILDVMGRVVLEDKRLSAREQGIDVQSLSRGIYKLEILSTEQRYILPFIKR